MKFNEKLIQLRKEKKLSQEALGEKLNVARQTVSKWELGETTPEMDKLVKMSEIFEISLDNLMKDAEVENNSSNNTNTQKLAGIVIFILKIIGVVIIVSIVLTIISTILFSTVRTETKVEEVDTQIVEEYKEV